MNVEEGVWLIVIMLLVEAEHPVRLLVTVSVTVMAPAPEKVIPVGFCAVEFEGLAPGPKFQL